MLDRVFGPLARRWAWAATALKVQQRFGEVRGGFLASAITLNVFLSLFPLLLVLIAIVGFITHNNTDVPEKVISNLGLTGNAANVVTQALDHASQTRRAASIIGLLGLAWSAFGVVGAIETTLDATWQESGRGIKDKLRGLLWGFGALVILGGSIGLTTALEVATGGLLYAILAIIAAIAINFIFWIWTFMVLSYQRITWHAYFVGAVFAAIGLEIIKQLATLLPQLFQGASTLYGSIGVVFGILAVLLLFGRVLVYASLINVVLWEKHTGTVTVEVEAPRIPGEVPLEGDRGGAVEN